MAETPGIERWEVVVEPVDDSSGDGVITLPAELVDQLAGMKNTFHTWARSKHYFCIYLKQFRESRCFYVH